MLRSLKPSKSCDAFWHDKRLFPSEIFFPPKNIPVETEHKYCEEVNVKFIPAWGQGH